MICLLGDANTLLVHTRNSELEFRAVGHVEEIREKRRSRLPRGKRDRSVRIDILTPRNSSIMIRIFRHNVDSEDLIVRCSNFVGHIRCICKHCRTRVCTVLAVGTT